jgi:hypothetical protein
VARAYRCWALAQPHRYRLLFGPPLPGYDAHDQRLVDAAQAAMNVLLEVLRDLGDGTAASPAQPLASQLSKWAQPQEAGADQVTALRAVITWSSLHGFVSLEIGGNYASIGIDADQVFKSQLAALTASGNGATDSASSSGMRGPAGVPAVSRPTGGIAPVSGAS